MIARDGDPIERVFVEPLKFWWGVGGWVHRLMDRISWCRWYLCTTIAPPASIAPCWKHITFFCKFPTFPA